MGRPAKAAASGNSEAARQRICSGLTRISGANHRC
jgi:hypothetical protein